MTTYFTNLQRAITATDTMGPDDPVIDVYHIGWHQVAEDLTYGLSLGSEHATQQQLQFWLDANLDTYQTDDPVGDMAYKARSEEIYRLMQSYKDIQ